jgi:hypothetical protein
MSTSRLGDLAVGFLQGSESDRRVVVATYDRVPGAAYGRTTRNARKLRRPELIWGPGLELWGPQTFKVFVDGVEVGTTSDHDRLRPPAPLADGRHTWFVTSTDRRGQTAAMPPRAVVVDTRRPRLSVRVTGSRRRGSALRVRVKASDPRGSGVRRTTIDFGDGSLPDKLRDVRHAYARPGRFALEVRAVDRAGNVTRRTIRVRIRG